MKEDTSFKLAILSKKHLFIFRHGLIKFEQPDDTNAHIEIINDDQDVEPSFIDITCDDQTEAAGTYTRKYRSDRKGHCVVQK